VSRSGSQQRTLLGILGRLRSPPGITPTLADRLEGLLRSDRRLGSRDRRLYRELAYAWLRHLPWTDPLIESDPGEAARRIAWLAHDGPSTRDFRSEVAVGLPECPEDLEEKARILGCSAADLTPGWFVAECPEAASPPLRDALLSRAPLWLRLQAADPLPVFREFDRLGFQWKRSARLAGALELAPGLDVTSTDAYAGGLVEIQDIGSQLVLEAAAVAPGGHWLDACAGAGGKALPWALALGAGGRVTARDIREDALRELSRRAARAGLSGRIDFSPSDPAEGFDGVLVDAPCSGTGTWRRAPHLRWATTQAAVGAHAERQLSILMENATRVRPGGRLVYATCSLCRTENEGVAGRFLEETRGFRAELAGKTLPPHEHDGDGFFVATFRRSLS
jgi:16S rRNA (cytosine967-C5)-methyltransferase